MRSGAILSAVYPVGIKAVEALLAAADRRVANGANLRSLSGSLDELTTRYADTKIAMAYSAFADLLRTIAMLVDWRAAVLGATVEADRFLRSARARHHQWREEFSRCDEVAGLADATGSIETLSEISDVGALCRAVALTPLPIGIFAEEPHRQRRIRIPDNDAHEEKEESETLPQLAVAFLRFTVDGTPASQTEFLTPHEAHDLEIEVRVSRWPDGAEVLRLAPVTIEPQSTYKFPEFCFKRPAGDPPYLLSDRGRAILHVAQALQAQPFEFRYFAEFEPFRLAEQPVAVVGQRTLRIESIDLRNAPISGYHGIDQKIVRIRNQLRQRPLVSRGDVNNTLIILTALGNLAGRAVQDHLFPKPIAEAAFQAFIRDELRRRPEIGSKLEEHPRAAGGTTDLSFERIRIELKSENDAPLRLPDCRRYVGQTSSYTAGSDKRIGVLCVLDGSPKAEQPFPPEDGVDVLTTADDAVAVITVLMQGNLARPSDLTRRARPSDRPARGGKARPPDWEMTRHLCWRSIRNPRRPKPCWRARW